MPVNISFHTSLVLNQWSIGRALGISFAAGCGLAIFCRVKFGAFLIWGFVVGILGLLFLWLAVAVLPLKWSIVFVLAIALPIAVLFYVDEQTVVTAAELEAAADMRGITREDVFGSDPDAVESIAATLNLGLDDPDSNFPKESVLHGFSKRVIRNAIIMLIAGYSVIMAAAVFVSQFDSETSADFDSGIKPDPTTEFLRDHNRVGIDASYCSNLSGIEFEHCTTSQLKIAEELLAVALEKAADEEFLEVLFQDYPGEVPREHWSAALSRSQQSWLVYRESTCDMVRVLALQGSGTGGFLQTCRLRMTLDRLSNLERIGRSFPDYQL